MAKQKFKITNWPTYNKALINRGSITFWLDDEAIQAWYESATPSSRGRPQRYSDLAITTVLVIKRVFRLTLRAAQGFIDSIFSLMNVPLRCPDYSCVSRRAKSVIPPRKGAGYWPGEYADRNRAVANQRMTGSNARWKWTTDYNRRSIAETAMYRVKQLFGGSLTLRDYDGQVAEAMALVRALNKMTKAGMPENTTRYGGDLPEI
ncbi:DDE transposase [Salmonella enterica]|nr:DDE transposase [Salmonella enterica]EAR6915880.1 DDE transposase [Salmonella enterica]EAT5124974.1 DDE transposase [Salmonella enterica]